MEITHPKKSPKKKGLRPSNLTTPAAGLHTLNLLTFEAAPWPLNLEPWPVNLDGLRYTPPPFHPYDL